MRDVRVLEGLDQRLLAEGLLAGWGVQEVARGRRRSMLPASAAPTWLASTEDRHRLGVLTGIAALGLDALASCAYGPEAIVLALAVAGSAGIGLTLPVTLMIVALLAVLVAGPAWSRLLAQKIDRYCVDLG